MVTNTALSCSISCNVLWLADFGDCLSFISLKPVNQPNLDDVQATKMVMCGNV